MIFASVTHFLIEEDPGFPALVGIICFVMMLVAASVPTPRKLPPKNKAPKAAVSKPAVVADTKKQN